MVESASEPGAVPVAGGSVDDADGFAQAADVAAEPPVETPAVDLTPPEEELTPEQREIAMLRDQLAKLAGRKDVEPSYDEHVDDDGEVIRIHFLEDGLTVNGRVMYRGEELEFPVGGRAYKDTFNKLGRTWLDLRNDEFAQVERFGKVVFRSGPWPGKTYADGTFEPLKEIGKDGSVRPPSAEQIEAAERARQRRSAPNLPSLISS